MADVLRIKISLKKKIFSRISNSFVSPQLFVCVQSFDSMQILIVSKCLSVHILRHSNVFRCQYVSAHQELV